MFLAEMDTVGLFLLILVLVFIVVMLLCMAVWLWRKTGTLTTARGRIVTLDPLVNSMTYCNYSEQ
ncbi:hypothetical protein Bpfe_017818, partial [Biomphalaria pfeifferi]